MPPSNSDMFVGVLAICIGLAGLYFSLSNHAGFYALHKIQWLETRFGRPTARWICVALALLLMALGGAIAMGYSLQHFLAEESAAVIPAFGSAPVL